MWCNEQEIVLPFSVGVLAVVGLDCCAALGSHAVLHKLFPHWDPSMSMQRVFSFRSALILVSSYIVWQGVA